MITPFDDRSGPGVLVLHSGRGLTEFVETVCSRLARNGFVAYAPDLFDGERPTSVEAADQLKAAFAGDELVAQVEDAAHFLRDSRRVSRRQVGVVGLGFGGELALAAAERDPDPLGALVVYYAFADVDWSALGVPVLGHFAELDPEISGDALSAAQRELEGSAAGGEFKLYAGTEPSFFENEPTARHDPSAARKSWRFTLGFLEESLTSGP